MIVGSESFISVCASCWKRMFIFSNVALLYLSLPVVLIFLFTYLLCFRYLAAMLKWRSIFYIIPSSGWNNRLIIKFLMFYPSSPILVSPAWAFVSEYRFWRKHVAGHFYENFKSLPLKEGKPFLPVSGPLCAAHTGGSSLGCAPHICLPPTSVCPSCYDRQRCLWLPICLKTMKHTKPWLSLGGCCCSLYWWPYRGQILMGHQPECHCRLTCDLPRLHLIGSQIWRCVWGLGTISGRALTQPA